MSGDDQNKILHMMDISIIGMQRMNGLRNISRNYEQSYKKVFSEISPSDVTLKMRAHNLEFSSKLKSKMQLGFVNSMMVLT